MNNLKKNTAEDFIPKAVFMVCLFLVVGATSATIYIYKTEKNIKNKSHDIELKVISTPASIK